MSFKISLASGSCLVVEYLPPHPEVNGLSLAARLKVPQKTLGTFRFCSFSFALLLSYRIATPQFTRVKFSLQFNPDAFFCFNQSCFNGLNWTGSFYLSTFKIGAMTLQPNGTQPNNIQRKRLNWDIQLNIFYCSAVYHYAGCPYVEWHYVKCCYTECCST